MKALDRLIEKEDFARIIQAMTPVQLTYARLRLAGLNGQEIATLCGCHRANVSAALKQARQTIAHTRPDLAHLLEDRRYPLQPSTQNDRVIDWDWLIDPSEED